MRIRWRRSSSPRDFHCWRGSAPPGTRMRRKLIGSEIRPEAPIRDAALHTHTHTHRRGRSMSHPPTHHPLQPLLLASTLDPQPRAFISNQVQSPGTCCPIGSYRVLPSFTGFESVLVRLNVVWTRVWRIRAAPAKPGDVVGLAVRAQDQN